MNTQKVEPCEFVAGLCSNCGASERGACEGWIAPDDRVQSLGEQIEALTKERDECRRQSDLQMNSAIKFCQERNAARIERDALAANHKDCVRRLGEALQDRADLAVAAKLALDALEDSKHYIGGSGVVIDAKKACEVMTSIRQAGVQ